MTQGRTGIGRHAAAAAAMLATAAALAGCASYRDITPSMPAAQVLATYGEPTARYAPQASAGERWQYSMEPSGREVWNVDFDAAGRVRHVEQALQEGLFAKRIEPGRWTRADVRREYGAPAYTMRTYNFDGDIWVYRYEIGPNWRMLYIDLDPAGVVAGYSVGDEYRELGADWR